MLDIDTLLRAVAENKGSDLHLKVGAPPTMRIDGALRRMTGPPLKSGDTTELVRAILPPDRKDRLDDADEVDFAYSVAGVARFRVNAFRQRGLVVTAARVARDPHLLDELRHYPPALQVVELGERDHVVRVTVLCPGPVKTPMLDSRGPVDLPIPASIPSSSRFLTRRAPACSPKRVARAVVRGIERNVPVIVVPWWIKPGWALMRISPRLLLRMAEGEIASVRREIARSSGTR